ncbi:unnamed protein product [Pleuronectes platessa]|uniref:Uncharacterized protein n=1 Tax=Pleuronectes platessa TaxID=8262 RepID=A0A9N7ZBL2_PLEPL|nr:unnamed protein product [Pleuronectes platessa]
MSENDADGLKSCRSLFGGVTPKGSGGRRTKEVVENSTHLAPEEDENKAGSKRHALKQGLSICLGLLCLHWKHHSSSSGPSAGTELNLQPYKLQIYEVGRFCLDWKHHSTSFTLDNEQREAKNFLSQGKPHWQAKEEEEEEEEVGGGQRGRRCQSDQASAAGVWVVSGAD